MLICACGCGEEIEPKPFHKYEIPKYKRGHWQKTGNQNRGKRTAPHRIPVGGIACACGCGTWIPEFHPKGHARYAKTPEPIFYVLGHRHATVRGAAHYNWKGGRAVTPQGYVRIKLPSHHLATKSGYVLEHRLIWEEANGRRLGPHDHVHHLNGIKGDNRPENLELLASGKHVKVTMAVHDEVQRLRERVAELEAELSALRAA